MMALFQRIFGHAESQRDGGAEMEQLNHQTTKLSNHQTIFSHKEHKEHKEQKVEATMSNHQTTKRPNYQTNLGQLARWAAVAAVAPGAWLESARDAEIAA